MQVPNFRCNSMYAHAQVKTVCLKVPTIIFIGRHNKKKNWITCTITSFLGSSQQVSCEVWIIESHHYSSCYTSLCRSPHIAVCNPLQNKQHRKERLVCSNILVIFFPFYIFNWDIIQNINHITTVYGYLTCIKMQNKLFSNWLVECCYLYFLPFILESHLAIVIILLI